MTDLRYKWNTPKGTLGNFVDEATKLGWELRIIGVPTIMGERSAMLHIGYPGDIEIECHGEGKTTCEAVGQALARARWITSRLTDPDLDPGLDEGPGDDVCDNQTNEEPT